MIRLNHGIPARRGLWWRGNAASDVPPHRPASEINLNTGRALMVLRLAYAARSLFVAGLFGAAMLVAPGTDALAEPQAYQFDKGHTQIRISWNHLGLSEQSALFREYEGSVTFDQEDVSKSAVNVTIDPASIDTGVPDFDDHMKSSDFFHVEEHPEVTFETTEVVQTGPNSGRMTGDLTIKG
ncbi:MAG: hypothetical protein GVX90_04195, partial [Alphaproteobacteria bacterium]|nr:hypothetical protein [Alphaproteobacteria bacterium]